jgi:phosphoadenosine phosphosulfate reductase
MSAWTRRPPRANELRSLAISAGHELETATASEVLRWAHETFGNRFAVASSMADGLLAHLAQRVAPGIEVIFLDTGYHFPETLGTRDAMAAVYDVRVRTVLPLLSVAQQDAEHGPELWRRDPDACCAMRKVEPLSRALEPYLAWGSGIRRDEAETRSSIGVVEWDARRGKVKVNPIATWTQEQVDAYCDEHGVLLNPLVYEGYRSIGCAPCTRPVGTDEDLRAGRWAGTTKVECGLHV